MKFTSITLRFVQYYMEKFVLDFLHFVNKRFSCCCPDLVFLTIIGYDGSYIYYVKFYLDGYLLLAVFCDELVEFLESTSGVFGSFFSWTAVILSNPGALLEGRFLIILTITRGAFRNVD